MKWNYVGSKVLIFFLIIAHCPRNALGLTAGDDVLIVESGSVEILRSNWSTYALATLGTVVHRGDLLRLEAGARAGIVCSDLTYHELRQYKVTGNPCRYDRGLLRKTQREIILARSDKEQNYPRILSPRRTRLLNPRPVIRWQRVDNVERYEVKIRGKDQIWEFPVEFSNRLDLSKVQEIELIPDHKYVIIVVGGGLRSSAEANQGLEFTVMAADERAEIEKAIRVTQTFNIEPEGQKFILAYLLASHGLYAEAIESLERLHTSRRYPAVARFLGALYLNIGLNRNSKEFLLEAHELSKKLEDVEGQALANEQLARVYEEALNTSKEARDHLLKAVCNYSLLGDSDSVVRIAEKISAYRSNTPTGESQ